MKIIPVIILIIFISAGCMSGSKTEDQATGPIPQTGITPVTNDSGMLKVQPASSQVNPVITSKPVSAAGLNPAHGQPGHRCDISVGAPLDSKPNQTTTQQQPAQVTPSTIAPVNNATAGSGLNPAHGQPGHRCDIPVGSPLNSKPAQ